MTGVLTRLRPGWGHERRGLVRQAVSYAGASVAASAVALVSTTILARNFSAEDFGAFAFSVSLFTFTSLFFGFGLFAAASRMAALAGPEGRRAIVGTALVLYIPVGIAFSVVLFGIAFVIGDLFAVEATHEWAVAVAALVGFAYPFQLAGEHLAQGTDRLHRAALGNAFFQVLFVAGLLALIAVGSLEFGSALVLRSVALAFAAFAVAISLRPVFVGVRALTRRVLEDTRRYGFQLYLARLLSIGTYNMDVLLIGIWASAEDVGYYALAAALSGVSGLPVIAVANSMFVRMAHAPSIDRRWITYASVGGGAIAVVGILLARPAIDIVFSDRYADVVPLLMVLLVAQAIRGVTTIYNVFLASHGRGAELRNVGLVLTASNLILNFALIPPYGAMGAAIASLGALTINFWAHWWFYRRSLREPT